MSRCLCTGPPTCFTKPSIASPLIFFSSSQLGRVTEPFAFTPVCSDVDSSQRNQSGQGQAENRTEPSWKMRCFQEGGLPLPTYCKVPLNLPAGALLCGGTSLDARFSMGCFQFWPTHQLIPPSLNFLEPFSQQPLKPCPPLSPTSENKTASVHLTLVTSPELFSGSCGPDHIPELPLSVSN